MKFDGILRTSHIIMLFIVFSLNGAKSQRNDPTVATTESTTSTTPSPIPCEKRNSSCDFCVQDKSCFYCQSTKECRVFEVWQTTCPREDVLLGTCIVRFRTLAIVVGCVAGVLILSITICCCCCCRKNQRARIARQLDKWEKERSERKAAAQERSEERAQRREEIRRKYGLPSPSNGATVSYKRFE